VVKAKDQHVVRSIKAEMVQDRNAVHSTEVVMAKDPHVALTKEAVMAKDRSAAHLIKAVIEKDPHVALTKEAVIAKDQPVKPMKEPQIAKAVTTAKQQRKTIPEANQDLQVLMVVYD
jgi:hypothetical protein